MIRVARGILIFLAVMDISRAQSNEPFRPEIPKVWDERAMREQELPVVVPRYSPKPLPADYYYKIPARTIYKSYPVYAPGRAPGGYLDKLKTLEPEVVFDAKKLKTKEDWIQAGELVFETPTQYEYGIFFALAASDPKFYRHSGVRLTSDGIMPYAKYVIRQKGKVEVGVLSCANCHTRVRDDGSVIKGGPGNFPLDRANAYFVCWQTLKQNRSDFRALYWIPWIPEREHEFESYSNEEMAALWDSIPLGVLARNRSSPLCPPAVPDLRGVRQRRYLDKSGLNQNRGLVSLMRYAALAEGMEFYLNFGGFIPLGGPKFDTLPPPQSLSRFSEEQLYALALYLSSLEPLPNPRPPAEELSAAGEKFLNGKAARRAIRHRCTPTTSSRRRAGSGCPRSTRLATTSFPW